MPDANVICARATSVVVQLTKKRSITKEETEVSRKSCREDGKPMADGNVKKKHCRMTDPSVVAAGQWKSSGGYEIADRGKYQP
jgi:hypothetical protein